jgi:4-aminobutyrate aminotransferase-like enzyme
MDDIPARKESSRRVPGERRTVPGPKSKATFEREARAMAPGLQSIALYSQLVVDRAKGCTITDVDGNDYLDFVAGIAVGSLGHLHPHYV